MKRCLARPLFFEPFGFCFFRLALLIRDLSRKRDPQERSHNLWQQVFNRSGLSIVPTLR